MEFDFKIRNEASILNNNDSFEFTDERIPKINNENYK